MGDISMNEKLIQNFLDEDGDEYSRSLLRDCIRENRSKDHRKEFNFNQFNVILDFKAGTALLQDEFEPGVEGEVELSLTQFESYLDDKSTHDGS